MNQEQDLSQQENSMLQYMEQQYRTDPTIGLTPLGKLEEKVMKNLSDITGKFVQVDGEFYLKLIQP